MRKFEFVSDEQVLSYTDDRGFAFFLPERSTKNSAGYDFRAPMDITIPAYGSVKIPTGVKAMMNPGEALFLFPRSSMGFKYGIRLMNTVGIVDAKKYE